MGNEISEDTQNEKIFSIHATEKQQIYVLYTQILISKNIKTHKTERSCWY